MKLRTTLSLLALGWAAVIALIVLNVRESSASKAAIEAQLTTGFSGITGALSPTATWSRTATAIHNGVIVGTATNDSAAAGEIGELVRGSLAVGSATTLSTGTGKNITSISLTAGDWDVGAMIGFGGSVAGATYTAASISTTSATLDGGYGESTFATPTVPNAASSHHVSIPPFRLSLSGTATVYLVAQGAFTSGSMLAWGTINARRVR